MVLTMARALDVPLRERNQMLLAAGFVAFQGALRHTKLTGLEREAVALTVSAVNDSEYSLAAHSVFAGKAGGSPEVVAALRAGDTVADGRLRSLQELTRSLLRERGHVETDLDEQDVLETIAQIAYTTFANYVANAARTPVDPAFAPE